MVEGFTRDATNWPQLARLSSRPSWILFDKNTERQRGVDIGGRRPDKEARVDGEKGGETWAMRNKGKGWRNRTVKQFLSSVAISANINSPPFIFTRRLSCSSFTLDTLSHPSLPRPFILHSLLPRINGVNLFWARSRKSFDSPGSSIDASTTDRRYSREKVAGNSVE